MQKLSVLQFFSGFLKFIADQVIYKPKIQNKRWVLQFQMNAKPAG